jgi:CBS domain-containing protein
MIVPRLRPRRPCANVGTARHPAGGAILESGPGMQVQEIMSKHVRGVTPDVDAESAWHYMQQHQVRHLVVVDGNGVVGVISDRDLGRGNGKAMRAERKVRDLMTPHALALSPETDVRDVAKLMRGLVVDCFPVIDGAELVGIITSSDLLDVVVAGERASCAR